MRGAGVVLLQAEVDPSIVKPGWTPLLVTVLLLLALVFLFFSMRKQIRRIHVPDDDLREESDREESDREESDEEMPDAGAPDHGAPDEGASAKPESR